jgi:hypothetical protein
MWQKNFLKKIQNLAIFSGKKKKKKKKTLMNQGP